MEYRDRHGVSPDRLQRAKQDAWSDIQMTDLLMRDMSEQDPGGLYRLVLVNDDGGVYGCDAVDAAASAKLIKVVLVAVRDSKSYHAFHACARGLCPASVFPARTGRHGVGACVLQTSFNVAAAREYARVTYLDGESGTRGAGP